MTPAIVVINAGSSSIKFALYTATLQRSVLAFVKNASAEALISGSIRNIGENASVEFSSAIPDTPEGLPVAYSHEQCIAWLLDWLSAHNKGYKIVAVGHRVVHGGGKFTAPVQINATVMRQLHEFVALAPLHQPHNLAAIEAVLKWRPSLPQVACFDTSFHATQAHLATQFAIPRALTEQGIIRYGFHGLSYQYIAEALPTYWRKKDARRVIVAHLGNGASMCAMLNGNSIATSMGFTALDGLMMGQRCGALDAGVILHLLRHNKMSISEVEHLLYRESGLLGVSGISNNMQVLLDSQAPEAKEAIDLFCYRAARELGSLICCINGLDAIVFTAGIGENAAQVRAQICEHLAWLGLVVDHAANRKNAIVFSTKDSLVALLIIPTDEQAVIAKETLQLLHMS